MNKLDNSYHFGWGYRAEFRPQVPVSSLQKYCKATNKVVENEDRKDLFHASCDNLGNDDSEKLETGTETWCCSNCKAVVLFLVVIRQFSVINVTCGFTMTALSSQNHNMK